MARLTLARVLARPAMTRGLIASTMGRCPAADMLLPLKGQSLAARWQWSSGGTLRQIEAGDDIRQDLAHRRPPPRPSGPRPRTHPAAPRRPRRSSRPASSASRGNLRRCHRGRASWWAAAGSFRQWRQSSAPVSRFPTAGLLIARLAIAAVGLAAFCAVQAGDAEDELAQEVPPG